MSTSSLSRFFLLLCLLVLLVSGNPASGKEFTWSNSNVQAVYNDPDNPTTFFLTDCAKIQSFSTYHWNDGEGDLPGTVTLTHEDGTIYGPWETTGEDGMYGVKDAYWVARPGAVLKAGTYTVTDSHPATWSQNDESHNRGMVTFIYEPVLCLNDTGTVPLTHSSEGQGYLPNGTVTINTTSEPDLNTSCTGLSYQEILPLLTARFNGRLDPDSMQDMEQGAGLYEIWYAPITQDEMDRINKTGSYSPETFTWKRLGSANFEQDMIHTIHLDGDVLVAVTPEGLINWDCWGESAEKCPSPPPGLVSVHQNDPNATRFALTLISCTNRSDT